MRPTNEMIENWDVLWFNVRLATMDGDGYGLIENAALAISGLEIAWLGPMSELDLDIVPGDIMKDGEGALVTPGLIDCHTHIVYAGNRSDEFEARLKGRSYQEIAAQGGGILATVKATREADYASLIEQSMSRISQLLSEGVTTLEIKSGYGLELETERKILKVAKLIGANLPVTVTTSYLAAHTLPPEYKDQADDYVDAVIDWMHILIKEGLIDAVDGYCEHLAFTPEQMQRIFDAAQEYGIPVKLHAEQLSNQEGAALVASYQGLSADHLEYLSDTGIQAMAQSGTVAVLAPGSFYTLRETKLPPIEKMREAGIKMAVSTDCNPETSPMTSLLLAMNMACTLFKLTPLEALQGVTIHAAKALGFQDAVGRLKEGFVANLAFWNIERPADLSYRMGLNPLVRCIYHGQDLSEEFDDMVDEVFDATIDEE